MRYRLIRDEPTTWLDGPFTAPVLVAGEVRTPLAVDEAGRAEVPDTALHDILAPSAALYDGGARVAGVDIVPNPRS